MKKENDSSIWGPIVKETNLYKTWPKEICLHITNKDAPKWKKLKKLLKEHVNINPDGGVFIVDSSLKIAETFFPLAVELGLDPIEFTQDRLDKTLAVVKMSIDTDNIKKMQKLKKSIIRQSDVEVKNIENAVVD